MAHPPGRAGDPQPAALRWPGCCLARLLRGQAVAWPGCCLVPTRPSEAATGELMALRGPHPGRVTVSGWREPPVVAGSLFRVCVPVERTSRDSWQTPAL